MTPAYPFFNNYFIFFLTSFAQLIVVRFIRGKRKGADAQSPILLTASHILEFRENGVLVVKNVLDRDEIDTTRKKYHAYLAEKGCDVSNLRSTAGALKALSSTGGSGGVLDIFYADWKLSLNENEKVVSVMRQLWAHTYSQCVGVFSHPYGPFDCRRGYMYIDRVCFRVPDPISQLFGTGKKNLQRSLFPHIDCCPHSLYESKKDIPKWRPIQAFIALTDTVDGNCGGFEACMGFHKDFANWAVSRPPSVVVTKQGEQVSQPPPCVGDFTPIRPVEDKDVLDRFQHISCRAGDMVIWDYRIPHANSRHNLSHQSREVVYVGFLPDVEVNKRFAKEQLRRFQDGLLPTDQWHEQSEKLECPVEYSFSPLGRLLMGIDDY